MSDAYDISIRLDGSDSTALVAWLNADGGSYLVVSEKQEENPHFHVYLRSTRKISAVRTSFKRAFPELKGNGSFSISQVRDVSKYYCYMMKGESVEVMAQVVAAHGVQHTDTAWQQAKHDEYWEVNEEINRRRKLLPVGEVVLAECKQKGIRWDDVESIGKVYIKELVARDKAINIFSVKSHVALIQVKLCPTDAAIEFLAAKLICQMAYYRRTRVSKRRVYRRAPVRRYRRRV